MNKKILLSLVLALATSSTWGATESSTDSCPDSESAFERIKEKMPDWFIELLRAQSPDNSFKVTVNGIETTCNPAFSYLFFDQWKTSCAKIHIVSKLDRDNQYKLIMAVIKKHALIKELEHYNIPLTSTRTSLTVQGIQSGAQKGFAHWMSLTQFMERLQNETPATTGAGAGSSAE